MSRNNGLGEVVSLNIPVSSDSNSFYSPSAINACRHANGIDWWIVLGKAYDRTAYEIYKVDKTGVSFHDRQFIGDTCSLTAPVGRLVFDPTGQKMARAGGVCAWSLFDFNRCSGVLSNAQNISTYRQDTVADYPVAANIAFSPNGRFVYVNTLDKLFQYDISEQDIKASESKIWQLDSLSWDYTILIMQLAPDNRIYVGPWWSSSDRKYLSVINKPNEKGMLSDFRLGGVPLTNMLNHGNGIPNMPNFRLGASPVYQMQAGTNRTICKDSTTQLGSAQKVNELIYNWRSTDPAAYISDATSHSPTVSTTADEALFCSILCLILNLINPQNPPLNL